MSNLDLSNFFVDLNSIITYFEKQNLQTHNGYELLESFHDGSSKHPSDVFLQDADIVKIPFTTRTSMGAQPKICLTVTKKSYMMY